MKKKILERVSELKTLRGSFKAKAQRNLQLYEDSLNVVLDDIRADNSVGLYKSGSQYDTTMDMSLNVIKSCIDTLVSKIASTKVRPFFNTVSGSFKDVKVVRQAQQYFDQSFEYKNINKVISNAFKNACIFDTGVVFINPFDHTIRNVLPWQVFFRPSELTYGKITRIYYEMKQYPTSLIPNYSGKEEYIAYGYYFDTELHVAAELYSDGKVVTHPYNADIVPFVLINYSSPIVGASSNSVVDMLISIQIEINTLMNKVKDASQLTPANTIFVPNGTGISVRKLNNGIGQVIGYDQPVNMTTSPVTVATPSFIDPNYMALIDELKETAYELVGLSQLSATSQKPSGLNSGVALQSLESIESDRFEYQLNTVIKAYVDIVKACIAVYDPNEDILPGDKYRCNITWKDIVEEDRNMKIQFSSADAISKDPSTKLQTLQALSQAGIIPANLIARYLEIPDIDNAYSVVNNAWNAVQTVIERCIEDNIFEVPAFIPFSLLLNEVINTQLSLYNADPVNNINDINKLTKLWQVVYESSQRMNSYIMAQNPPEPQVGEEEVEGEVNA